MDAASYIFERQVLWARRRAIPLQGSEGERGQQAYTPALEDNLFEPLSPHEASEVRVRLAPCRVFFANQVWYLAASNLADGQVKLYRLSRFRSMEVLKSPAAAPPFSLRDFLGNAWTVYRGERDYTVEVEFGPEAAPLVAECRWHHTQELEEMPGGRLLFRATISGLEEVKYWVLGWGPRAVVRRPQELVEEMRRLLRETLGHYEGSTHALASRE